MFTCVRRALITAVPFAAFMLTTLCQPLQAMPAGGQEFSATLVGEDGGNVTKSKIHYTLKKQRIEADSGEGDKAIIIMRLDKNVVWSLMPSEKMYMEMAMTQGKENPLALEEDAVIKRERIGKETVDGHPAIKEKVVVKNRNGTKDSLYYWQATDIGWPIKAAALDGSWSYTYKDIKVGRQDPSLFEVPKGYKKMSMDRYTEPPDYPEPPDFEPPDAPEPYIPSPGIPSPPVPW